VKYTVIQDCKVVEIQHQEECFKSDMTWWRDLANEYTRITIGHLERYKKT